MKNKPSSHWRKDVVINKPVSATVKNTKAEPKQVPKQKLPPPIPVEDDIPESKSKSIIVEEKFDNILIDKNLSSPNHKLEVTGGVKAKDVPVKEVKKPATKKTPVKKAKVSGKK